MKLQIVQMKQILTEKFRAASGQFVQIPVGVCLSVIIGMLASAKLSYIISKIR